MEMPPDALRKCRTLRAFRPACPTKVPEVARRVRFYRGTRPEAAVPCFLGRVECAVSGTHPQGIGS